MRHSKMVNKFIVIAMLIALFSSCSFFCREVNAMLVTGGEVDVVIDAGHGGIDGGAVGVGGTKESHINLAIAKKLKMHLINFGVSTAMTRETEDGLYGDSGAGFKRRDMRRRKEIILSNSPKIVVSVHMNISSYGYVRGGQVFYHKPSPQSRQLAETLQAQLNGVMKVKKDRAALSGDYYLLRCAPPPSVIVECGFLSNREEEQLLLSEDYQDTIARAIAIGIQQFLSGSN